MSRPKLLLEPHLSSDQLKARYRTCKEPKEARRWHALWLASQGHSSLHVAAAIGLHDAYIRRLIHRYNDAGPDSVVDGHRSRPGGRQPRLSVAQLTRLRCALEGQPPDGGLWTGPKVAAWIERETRKPTYPQLGWVYLRRLGQTTKTPRRRHARAASPAQRAAFKKNSAAR